VSGIAGFVAPLSQRPDPSVLERMTRSVQHRGADVWGYYVDARFGLGVARRRLTDVEGQDQPVSNEDGSVRAVLYGDIYNFQELRDGLVSRGHRFSTGSETEVVAHAWQEYGDQCLPLFNGMFALAIWDDRREQLVLARDRMGDRHLYYAVAKGWLIFASELHAVLVHSAVDYELELATVSRSLGFDFVTEPHSIICGISKLPRAHCLTASNGRVTVQSYWDVSFNVYGTARAEL